MEYFQKAMENAKAVLDNENATQTEVNKAWDDLLEAIWGLGINQGDKTLLNVLITKAEEMEKNADKYVETHWQELLDALKAAKEVSADGGALQAEVDEAANALHQAILLQRYKANKENLEDLINKANGMDLSGYTLESVTVFKAALANAKLVLADESLSEDDQKIVDSAVEELSAAIKQLSTSEEPSNPDDSDKEEDSSEKPDEGEKPDSPATGDSNNGFLWFAVVFAGLMAAVLVVTQRKKSMNHE